MRTVCTVKLPGKGNYALISPGRVTYGLDASESELNDLIEKEKGIPVVCEDDDCQKETDSLAVIMTNACNLECIYCYSRGGDTEETVTFPLFRAIVLHTKERSTAERFDLYLVGGGEPLLMFDLVQQFVTWLDRQYKTVNIHVVSNGTFFEDACDWLICRNASVRISSDGVMHNKQRPWRGSLTKTSSSSVVEKNIRTLVTAGLEPMIQCIVTQDGLGTMVQTVNLAIQLGVKTIKIEPALATDVSRGGTSVQPNPKDFVAELLETIRYVAKTGIDLKIDTGFFGEPSQGYYCGMAASNMMLTPFGQLTSCVEVARPDDPYAEEIIYGTVLNDGSISINQSVRDALAGMHFNNQIGGCVECELRMICLGGCPMANIWKSGFPLRKSWYTCQIEHMLLPELLLDIVKTEGVGNVVLDHNANIC